MVEATIALPVLILLLIGATFFRELHLARASVRLSARGCAWAYASQGCTGAQPDACDEAPEAAYDGQVPNIEQSTRARVTSADNPFEDVPVVSEALSGLFGRATRASSEATVPFPLDDERVGVAHAENVVVCNSVPTEVIDIAKELLCEHLGC